MTRAITQLRMTITPISKIQNIEISHFSLRVSKIFQFYFCSKKLLRYRGKKITHSRILFLLHQQRIFLVSCMKQSTYLLSSQGFKTKTLWPTQSNLINMTLPGKVRINFTLTDMPPAQFFYLLCI